MSLLKSPDVAFLCDADEIADKQAWRLIEVCRRRRAPLPPWVRPIRTAFSCPNQSAVP